MCGSRRISVCTGEEGLLRLLKKAHSFYCAEVKPLRKSYHRFAVDFIHSIRYHDDSDAWSKNEHRKNYCIVVSLLLRHEKTVRKFFDCESVDEQELTKLLEEFYASDLPQPPIRSNTATEILCQDSSEQNTGTDILLDRKTIDLIVRLANEVNLSKEVLNADEIIRAYEKRKMKSIVSTNNVRLALVLDRLSRENIIPYNWQTLIERRKLILSSTGKKFLSRHDLASTLNRVKEMPLSPENTAVLSIVDKYVKLIKDSQNK